MGDEKHWVDWNSLSIDDASDQRRVGDIDEYVVQVKIIVPETSSSELSVLWNNAMENLEKVRKSSKTDDFATLVRFNHRVHLIYLVGNLEK